MVFFRRTPGTVVSAQEAPQEQHTRVCSRGSTGIAWSAPEDSPVHRCLLQMLSKVRTAGPAAEAPRVPTAGSAPEALQLQQGLL
jgi:hypothetical protein